MARFKNFYNKITNDGRIFSFEDVINIPHEEDKFYSAALDYQCGKIGFPREKELQNSINVSKVDPFTYEDGSITRAHFRSNDSEQFIDPNKPFMTTPSMEKRRINKLSKKFLKSKSRKKKDEQNENNDIPIEDNNALSETLYFETGIEYNYKQADYRWDTNDGACDKCKELDNKKFESKEDIPPKPHPNCKCEVKVIEKSAPKQYSDNKVEGNVLEEGVITKDWLKNLQDNFYKDQNLSKMDLTSAKEYYQIALTKGEVIDTVYRDNAKTTVGRLKDNDLKNHVLQIKGVNNNSMVVIPKQNARIINQIKKSKEFKTVIKGLLKNNSIKLGNNSEVTRLDYISKNPKINGIVSADLALTIGHAHLHNTHLDEQGNLYTTLVDWYDFNKFPENDIFDQINNNAYEQQSRGDLTNYVLLIPIVLTKTEMNKL